MSEQYDLTGIHGAEIFRNLAEGLKLELNNGAIAEITGNPQDGGYVIVEYLEYPSNPAKVGEEEAVYFLDVKRVIV